MQILRIILMVFFVFTVYPSIGEAVDMEEGSKTKSTLKATTSHPLSLNTDPNTEQVKRASPSLLNGIDNARSLYGSEGSGRVAIPDSVYAIEEEVELPTDKVGIESEPLQAELPLGKEGRHQPVIPI